MGWDGTGRDGTGRLGFEGLCGVVLNELGILKITGTRIKRHFRNEWSSS
jgi:hypothetical protein